ncbi:ABC transporter permease [Staphylococcus caeli]|uniref:ABC transporter permease n=1 Tax=Staphylococcus caeli TaxID=2201815 RepID=A0A1D4N676_9STAP|nr:ABC transporter permease [Staphylococcus caeli]SCT43060.1 ABC transporter permease [Staphylococcus caeli]
MLISFLKYENTKFFNSYQMIAPIFLYLLSIIANYIYKDLPILSSYGSTAIFLLLTMTWLTIMNFKHDSINERDILYIHLSSKLKYLTFKLINLILLSFPLILISIVYPLIINSFDKKITVNFIVISLIVHVLLSIFGILLGAFVSNTNLASKPYRWLFTVFVIIITLTKVTLVDSMSFLKWFVWIMPPISELLSLLNSGTLLLYNGKFLMYCMLILIYYCLLLKLTIHLFLKQK